VVDAKLAWKQTHQIIIYDITKTWNAPWV